MVSSQYSIGSTDFVLTQIVRDSNDTSGLRESQIIAWHEFFDDVNQGKTALNSASVVDLGYPGAFHESISPRLKTIFDTLGVTSQYLKFKAGVVRVFEKSWFADNDDESVSERGEVATDLGFSSHDLLKALIKMDLEVSAGVLTMGDVVSTNAFNALPEEVQKYILDVKSTIDFHGASNKDILNDAKISLDDGSEVLITADNAPLLLYILREASSSRPVEDCVTLGPFGSLIISEVLIPAIRNRSLNSLDADYDDIRRELGDVLSPDYFKAREAIRSPGQGFGSLIRILDLSSSR